MGGKSQERGAHGGSNLLRKEPAHGKQGRKTLGAKGAGQHGDIRNEELSLPSAHSCRPWEANSVQDFAIYTDNFTRGHVGKVSSTAWEQAAQGPRSQALLLPWALSRLFFAAAAPNTTLCLAQTLKGKFSNLKTEINQQPLLSQSMLGQAGSSVRN